MSWGALYFYYKCQKCGKLFKYAVDLLVEFGDEYGNCPDCMIPGTYLKEGARTSDDLLFTEVE